VRFSPVDERERNALLIAWRRQIEEIAEHPTDPGVARLKLEWWREEVARLCAGAARHPLATGLHAAGIDHRALGPMLAIVDAAEDEIRSPDTRDHAAFIEACRAGQGSFFVFLAALGGAASADPELCRRAGAYCAAVERIRRSPLAPGRVPEDLRPPALRNLTPAQRGARCERLLDSVLGGREPPVQLLPDLARRLTALATAMHRKIRRKGYPVADTVIDRAPIAHLWTAWRCR
jgi:phytoene synthase